MLSKLILCFSPGILFCIIFYLLDKNKSKKETISLVIIFLLGAIGSYICYRLEWHFGSYFPKMKDSNMLQVLIYAIFGVAIFEEGCKWLFTSIFTFINKVESMFTVIVYSVFCSAGFATFENYAFYVMKGDINTAIARLFTAVPSHICNAIIMGLLIGIAIKSKNKIKKIIFYLLALVSATMTHAIYNWLIYKEGLFDIRIHLCYFVILCIICLYICILVRKKE